MKYCLKVVFTNDLRSLMSWIRLIKILKYSQNICVLSCVGNASWDGLVSNHILSLMIIYTQIMAQ